jgi:hypothetical protein
VLCPGAMGKKNLPSEAENGQGDHGHDNNGEDQTNEFACCMLDEWISSIMQPTGSVVLHEFLLGVPHVVSTGC